MARNDKPTEVKEAERTGGETFTPGNQSNGNVCPDCKGEGIRNPAIDHQVCQTCQGTGRA